MLLLLNTKAVVATKHKENTKQTQEFTQMLTSGDGNFQRMK